jgi:hypothetical protein
MSDGFNINIIICFTVFKLISQKLYSVTCSVVAAKLNKDKGKAIPLQAWTGPEGSTRVRLPDFKTIGTWRW